MARVHHRTTTATLLVTVAVSALSGCMTVQRPLAPGPATAPAGTGPRPVGEETQIVQAPASEALEMVGTPRSSTPPASPSHRAGPSAAPDRNAPADGRNGQPRSARPEPDRSLPPRRPPVELPDVTASMRPGTDGGADLCALGREYGGWRADSPESAICQDTYGR